jgi:hypothetical protein
MDFGRQLPGLKTSNVSSLSSHCLQPFAQWIRSKAKTVATINSVLQLDGNVHVFVIIMDGQRSRVPILSDEEGLHLKRWVNNGGRLFAFVGHEAEKSPGYSKVSMSAAVHRSLPPAAVCVTRAAGWHRLR